MGTQTLAAYTDTGITLTTAGADLTPFTITQAGTIYANNGSAGVLSNVAGAALLNAGTILAGPNVVGVYLQSSGSVTNTSTGTISGNDGVYLGDVHGGLSPDSDSEYLSNAGLINATNDGVHIRGSLSTIINTGTISGAGGAVYFIGGGYISNSGTLAGAYGVHWIDEAGAALTFVNTGTVLASLLGVDAGGDGNQTIVNENLIDGAFKSVYLSNKGVALDTLINTGTILSDSFGVLTATYGNTAIFNQGVIEDGVRLQNSGTGTDFLDNTGSINGFAGIEVYTSGGRQTIINQGTISGETGILLGTSLASGTTIENAGTILSTFGASGTAIGDTSGSAGPLTLIVDPGAAFIGTVSGGGGVLEFAAGTGRLAGVGAQFIDFSTFALASGASWTVSGTLDSSSDEVITGFGHTDTIDITNLVNSGTTLATLSGNDVLTLEQGGDALNLTFSGDTGAVLTLSSDGAGGTDITTAAICYMHGTRILTPTGEVPVEALKIGDAVVTRFGGIRKIRWIGRQNYDWRFVRGNMAKRPVRIAAGALGENLPARELAVSPGHSLLLGDVLILARDLVNGVTVRQDFNPARDTGALAYFQIELDSHDCVIAEGCWAETYADAPGLRAQFHNAAAHQALYPEAPPADELRLCAPRPEQGRQFEAALRPVLARAWAAVTPGRLEGWVERVSGWRVTGWALDASHPALAVLLEVWQGEVLLGTTLARSPARGDLARAGKGAGTCAFSFAAPVRLSNGGQLRVIRPADGAELPHVAPREARRLA